MDYIDFPERKVSIFEPDQNNYFFRSGKFTYLCSYSEAKQVDMANAFPGAFVLCLYKRYSIMKAGKVIYRNELFDENNNRKGKFVIISSIPSRYYIHSWGTCLESYELRSDKDYNAGLNPIKYESGAEAEKIAASLSSENNYTYIVAQLYDSYDRH